MNWSNLQGMVRASGRQRCCRRGSKCLRQVTLHCMILSEIMTTEEWSFSLDVGFLYMNDLSYYLVTDRKWLLLYLIALLSLTAPCQVIEEVEGSHRQRQYILHRRINTSIVGDCLTSNVTKWPGSTSHESYYNWWLPCYYVCKAGLSL